MALFAELIDPDLPGYRLAVAPAGNLAGVLSDQWLEAGGQAGTAPVFTADADQAATVGASEGATLTIDGTGYTVAERQPVNGGGVSLRLSAQ